MHWLLAVATLGLIVIGSTNFKVEQMIENCQL